MWSSEVARARLARAEAGDVTQRELVDALERARVTAEALDRIRQRLEVMARSPASPATATGADGDAGRDGCR